MNVCWVPLPEDADLVGEREGHCSLTLPIPSDPGCPQWVVVVLGGFLEGEFCSQIIGLFREEDRYRWKVIGESDIALREGATLVASAAGGLLFGGMSSEWEKMNDLYRLWWADRLLIEKVVDGGTRPSPRYRHASCSNDIDMFVFGGETNSGPSSELHALSLGTFVWTLIDVGGCVPQPRFGAVLLNSHDVLVMIGGAWFPCSGAQESLADSFFFNLQTRTWSKFVDLPAPLNGHVGFVVGHRIIYVTGKDGAEGSDDIFVLSLDVMAISRITLASGPHWRYLGSLALLPESHEGVAALIIGGQARHPDPVPCYLLLAR